MFYFAPLYEEWVDASTFDIKGYENGRGKSTLRIYETCIITAGKKKDKIGCSKNQAGGFRIITDHKVKTKFTFLWETIKDPETQWYSAVGERRK